MTPSPPEPLPELDVAWERPGASFGTRLLGTLGAAFAPGRSAAAMRADDAEPALSFLWLTAVPLAMLAGIIPHTRTLLFGDFFGVKLADGVDQAAIALDIGRAMVVQLSMFVVDFMALSLPFASLSKAYGSPQAHAAALRLLCYRAWLIPAAALLYSLIAWGAPAPPPPSSPGAMAEIPFWLQLLVTVPFMLHVLVVVGMWFTARRASQLGPGMSMVVTIIPLVLWSVLQMLELEAVNWVLPPPAVS